LGIFGSLSSHILTRAPKIAESLNLQAQATFRTVSLAEPDMLAVVRMLLKAEGYQHYDTLARLTSCFLAEFTRKKNEILYGKAAADSRFIDRVTEKLVLRDVRIAVRFAILLRDQEWSGVRDALFRRQQRQWKFELQLFEKTLAEKEAELAQREAQHEQALRAKADIEADTLREGFRNILRSKFTNEWRAAKQEELTRRSRGDPKARIDEKAAEDELEALVRSTYEATAEQIQRAEAELAGQEAAADAAAAGAKGAADGPAANAAPGAAARRAAAAAKRPRRKLTHAASTAELNFATKRQADEAEFLTRIEGAFAKVVAAR
jgi:hypothetical protein